MIRSLNGIAASPFEPPVRPRPERPEPPGASGPPRPVPALLGPTGCVAILALLTLARLMAAAAAGLSEDEAYYRLWALEPAFGYLDHPPMIGWWIAAGIGFVGDDALGVRMPGVLATLVASMAVWRIALLLSADLATAGRAAIWFNATLLIGVGAVIATPDLPSVLFWTLALWAIAELRTGEDDRWWLAVGVFAGLGLLSKYSVLFLGAGIVLWLLLAPDMRRAFRSPWLWAGGAVALVLFAPVVAWNAANGWASFEKQFGRAVPSEFRPELVLEFLGAQILLVGPLMVPFLAIGIGRIVRLGPTRASLAWALLATSLPFFAYLVAHGFHARVQGNWPAPLYAAVAVIAAVAAADLPEGRAGRVLRALRAAVAPVGLGLCLVAFLHLSGDRLFLTDRDTSKRLRGWPAFTTEVDLARQRADADWVGTIHWGTTGQMAFGLRATSVPVVPLADPLRWTGFPEETLGALGPGLVVVLERRTRGLDLESRFETVEALGTLERSANGVRIRTYRLYRVADPVDPAETLPVVR